MAGLCLETDGRWEGSFFQKYIMEFARIYQHGK